MVEGLITEAEPGTRPEPEALTYRLVPEQSEFTVQAFAQGLLSAFGHDPVIIIREFAGSFQFNPATYEAEGLKITVNSNALAVSNDVKEKDRVEIERTMRAEVLETGKYPEIVFSSSNITVNQLSGDRCRVRVIGDLKLHGATQRNVWISAEATLAAASLRAQGQFSLRQTDFGIKPYSAAGGTIKLKNELKFSFDISARKD